MRLLLGFGPPWVRDAARERSQAMAAGLQDLPGVEAVVFEPAARPAPQVDLRLLAARTTAADLVIGLAAGDPPIILSESGLDAGVVSIVSSCLAPEEDERVVAAVRRMLMG